VYLHPNLEESQKILHGAAELFMRIGIKSVSMDDLARELGISKKTIYKHFADKKELISKVLQADIAREKATCKTCYSTEENAVQKMINISRHISHQHKDINPTVIYDLQKYYPQEWAQMEKFQNEFIHGVIVQNVQEGQAAGFYRKDLNALTVASMYATLIQGMMMQLASKDNPFNFKTLHMQMVSYHLHGICTETGREYLQNHINEITNEQ
jgi:AcrR family transcriptional regulator